MIKQKLKGDVKNISKLFKGTHVSYDTFHNIYNMFMILIILILSYVISYE